MNLTVIRSLSMRNIAPILLLLILCGDCAFGNDSWGNTLFKAKSHDFGTVIVGSEAIYRFELTNPFLDAIQLVQVTSSCGCTRPKFSQNILKPGETGAVIAQLNTGGQFLYDKYATLTVKLQRAGAGADTVLLSVEGYIRPDILLQPTGIELGAVSEGQTVSRIVQLEYTGSNNRWALISVERSLPFIYAKAEEIQRYADKVVYRITATLKKDAPPGYVKDVLRFKTNEPAHNQVLIPIHGVVDTPMVVKPSPLFLGLDDSPPARNLVLRNTEPFRITGIESDVQNLHFTFSEQESGIQIVTVSGNQKPKTDGHIEIHYRTATGRKTVTVNAETSQQ